MSNRSQPHASGLCGAKTRSGTPCKNPPIRGRFRCRMHGGSSPGAPKGNQNGWKHGLYCAAAIEERRQFRVILKQLQGGIELAAQETRIR